MISEHQKHHHTDISAVVDFLVSEGAREVFLIGTSRGTVSVAYLASVMTHANVKGYVLTASLEDVVFYTEKIKRPVLMAHHADDECHVTTLTGARAAFRHHHEKPPQAFRYRKRRGYVEGTCLAGPMSAHGFIGAERETVGVIVEWMNGGTPPEYVSP